MSEALADTPWYLRLLRDEGSVAQRLASLLGGSQLIADLLTTGARGAPAAGRRRRRCWRPNRTTVADGAAGPGRAGPGSAQEAVDAARSARRHEMLRLACGDLLGLISVTNIARGLTSVAEATMQAALRRRRQAGRPAERGGFRARFAVIGMGRLGGAELGYSSDADVMFVMEPLPGEDDHAARADANAVADLMSRLLGRPTPDPPLEIDAEPATGGQERPAGPTARRPTAAYWARTAVAWERQALLRARPVAGDAELGAEFIAAADDVPLPGGRAVHARRGGDPADQGAGGRRAAAPRRRPDHPHQAGPRRAGRRRVDGPAAAVAARRTRCRSCGRPSPCRRSRPPPKAGLISDADADGADQRLARGDPDPERDHAGPRQARGPDPAPGPGAGRGGPGAGYPAGGDPGEFVDDYRRATRRARKVVDRIFDGG